MAIKHFDHSHQTVAEVRACRHDGITKAAVLSKPIDSLLNSGVQGYDGRIEDFGGYGEPATQVHEVTAGNEVQTSWSARATDKMVRYVRTLVRFKDMSAETRLDAQQMLDAHDSGDYRMGFAWARAFINAWKDAPDITAQLQSEPTRVAEDGMYRNPETGDIFKVQFPREKQGEVDRLYAKRLVVEADAERDVEGGLINPAKVKFVYESGLIKEIHPAWLMTLEEAKAFGALYGTCCVCGRTLTREQSINAGIGPKCGEGGRWAAAKETVEVAS